MNSASLFRSWFLFAVVITILAGTIYLTVQQNYRMNANDPQISLSQEIARNMTASSDAADQQALVDQFQSALTMKFVPGKTDMTESLEPFVIVYDATGKPVASTAQLDGNTPTVPSGVLAYAQANGQDRFTWEPEAGVREAAVITYFSTNKTVIYTSTSTGAYIKSGFVLAARSLTEVEKRESQLTVDVFLGWIAALLLSFIIILFV